jgi:GTP cyclohydrolase I
LCVFPDLPDIAARRPRRARCPDIERSFRDLLRWVGEDPDRDGLRETPGRVMRAFQEYFSGYR